MTNRIIIMVAPLIFPLIWMVVMLIIRCFRLKKMREVSKEMPQSVKTAGETQPVSPQQPSRVDKALLDKVNKKLKKAAKRGKWYRKGALYPIFILMFFIGIAFLTGWEMLMNLSILVFLFTYLPYTLIYCIVDKKKNSGLRKKFYREYLPVLLQQEFADYRPQITAADDDLRVSGSMQLRNEKYGVAAQFSVYPCYHQKQGDNPSYYTIEQTLRLQIIPAQNPIRHGTIQLRHDYKEAMGHGIADLPVNMVIKTLEGVGNAISTLNGQQDRDVLLEDPEFEKYFEVRADDQVESRMFLTPVQMQTLCQFRKGEGPMDVQYTPQGITVLFRDYSLMGTYSRMDIGVPDELDIYGRIHLDNILQKLPMLWEEDVLC